MGWNVSDRYRRLKERADRRGISVAISVGEYRALVVNAVCWYCGMRALTNQRTGGLDRLDNARGYEIGNVVPCCTPCNRARGAMLSPDEFKAAISVRLVANPGKPAWPESSYMPRGPERRGRPRKGSPNLWPT